MVFFYSVQLRKKIFFTYFLKVFLIIIPLQVPNRVDFSSNPMHEPSFDFYDKTLLDDVKRGVAPVHEFFRLLSLCHTVMADYKEGMYISTQCALEYAKRVPKIREINL